MGEGRVLGEGSKRDNGMRPRGTRIGADVNMVTTLPGRGRYTIVLEKFCL